MDEDLKEAIKKALEKNTPRDVLELGERLGREDERRRIAIDVLTWAAEVFKKSVVSAKNADIAQSLIDGALGDFIKEIGDAIDERRRPNFLGMGPIGMIGK